MKYPDDAWPEEWFVEKDVVIPRGETVTLHLAEMGSLIGTGKDAIWVREANFGIHHFVIRIRRLFVHFANFIIRRRFHRSPALLANYWIVLYNSSYTYSVL